jgi:predicted nicotinamide N-methyase
MSAGPKDQSDYARFITANTKLLAPPNVPEIRLHLAEESLPIWQKTEEELGQMNVPPPFWAFAWAGGQALARYLLDHPHEVANKTVLDLGTGSGLTAIAAKKAGARSVLAADIDVMALASVHLNAIANDVAVSTTDRNLLDDPPGEFEVLLVGDLFYERELADRVLAYLVEAGRKGTRILVGDPQRSYFPAERFDRVAEYEVAVTRELEDALVKRTSVWALVPIAGPAKQD